MWVIQQNVIYDPTAEAPAFPVGEFLPPYGDVSDAISMTGSMVYFASEWTPSPQQRPLAGWLQSDAPLRMRARITRASLDPMAQAPAFPSAQFLPNFVPELAGATKRARSRINDEIAGLFPTIAPVPPPSAWLPQPQDRTPMRPAISRLMLRDLAVSFPLPDPVPTPQSWTPEPGDPAKRPAKKHLAMLLELIWAPQMIFRRHHHHHEPAPPVRYDLRESERAKQWLRPRSLASWFRRKC